MDMTTVECPNCSGGAMLMGNMLADLQRSGRTSIPCNKCGSEMPMPLASTQNKKISESSSSTPRVQASIENKSQKNMIFIAIGAGIGVMIICIMAYFIFT